MSGKIAVDVDGHRLTLTNLEKVLYPQADFTKRDVIDYFQRVAKVMLPHVRERAATFVRFPNGTGESSFFEKNVGTHAPGWLRTATLRTRHNDSRDTNDYPVLDDRAALVWAGNLAALEIHVPQWKLGPRDGRNPPNQLVFDLDPGPGTDIVDCCRLALRLRAALAEDDLVAYPKTSGSKGMQLYSPIECTSNEAPSGYAKKLAERLAQETPDEVVAKMAKNLRKGKVFIDWSQNNPAKTTIAPYSLRGKEEPTVSTPITWDEVSDCTDARELQFTASDVLERIDDGDLMAGLLTDHRPLPT